MKIITFLQKYIYMKILIFFSQLFSRKKEDNEADEQVIQGGKEPFTEKKLMQILNNSTLPFVRINAIEATNFTLIQSKFLGLPYLPKGFLYPTDSNRQPLILLAQINFAELPPLPNYPTNGILQFYISTTGDL